MPARSLRRSQHFLRDPLLACALVDELRLPRGSLVLEIGAGRGVITRALADAGFRVIAVENDVRLYRSLRARFIGRTNVECHLADALDYAAPSEPHTVVSNVPYHITADVVRSVVTSAATEALLIVQREAAEKFAGTPSESLFSLLHKPSFEISMGRAFERTDFDPPPSVESVLLRLHRRASPLLEPREATEYDAFVRASFGRRRQRARDALRRHFTERQLVRLMHDLRIPRDARPSEINVAQWLALFRFAQRLRLDAWPRGRTPRAPALVRCDIRRWNCGERWARVMSN
jgi:23S rRNA (adenine-N6)-dimethyltransferase